MALRPTRRRGSRCLTQCWLRGRSDGPANTTEERRYAGVFFMLLAGASLSLADRTAIFSGCKSAGRILVLVLLRGAFFRWITRQCKSNVHTARTGVGIFAASRSDDNKLAAIDLVGGRR